MKLHYWRTFRFLAVNDENVNTPTFDFTGSTDTQLVDRHTALMADIEELRASYEGYDSGDWEASDATALNNAVAELEAVTTEQQIRPAAQLARVEALNLPAELGNLSRTVTNLAGSIRITNPTDDHPTAGYNSTTEFLSDVVQAYNATTDTQIPGQFRNHIMATNAVGEDEFSRGDWKSGGALVPEGFLDRVISITPEDDQLFSRMTEVPMGAPTVKIPALVDKSHATSFTGGMRAYRTSETRTPEASRDQFEKVSMEVSEVIVECHITKALMRHSPISIPALVERSADLALQYKMQDELMVGDGVGKFLGILNNKNPARVSLTQTAGTVAHPVAGVDVLKMRKACFDFDNAVWVASWDLYEALAQVHIESPNNAGILKLYSPPTGGAPDALLGRPIVWTEFMPGLQSGTDGSPITEWGDAAYGYRYLALVAPRHYYYGQTYSGSAQSVHVRFREREETFQWVLENDARPAWKSVLTPKRGVTQRAPIVTLASQ